jgi:hypothetical protein
VEPPDSAQRVSGPASVAESTTVPRSPGRKVSAVLRDSKNPCQHLTFNTWAKKNAIITLYVYRGIHVGALTSGDGHSTGRMVTQDIANHTARTASQKANSRSTS